VADAVALGLDLGTSGVRVVAVSAQGELVAEATRDYPLLTPRPGWTEQRPEEWRQAAFDALREVVDGLGGRELLAIGLSGQMHGLVALDAEGMSVRPAILWNDQRTGEAVQEIEARVPRETLIARTGNPAITGFQLAKLVWLRREEPEAFARVKHVLLPKDYLTYVLTGEKVAEPTDASGTNAFHLATKRWDEGILKALGVPLELYPRIIASHEVAGTLTREAAQATGLPAGLPVVAGAGDNAAAAVGLGLSSARPGMGSVSLGTSGVVFAPLSEATPEPEGRAHLFCHADGGYHLLGVTLSAAGSLAWYRRTFVPDKRFDELMALAAQSPAGAHGVTFKPYLAGERTPHLKPDLRGSWTGLSLATTQADMVRSVLEGVACSLRDALDVMAPLATLTEGLATGGGARSELWLQIVSDTLELPLAQVARHEGAAYGAALLALQGSGAIESWQGLEPPAITRRFEPGEGVDVYREVVRRYRSGPDG
jgi:xylulokinase